MDPREPSARGHPLARALLYLVCVLTVSLAIGFVVAIVLDLERSGAPPTLTPFDLLITGLLLTPVELLLTHLFLRRVDRRTWREIFAAWRRGEGHAVASWMQVACGWGLAAGLLGLVLVACAAAGWVRLAGWGPAAGAGWLPAVGAAVMAVAGAFLQGGLEEVVFRGYVMHNLALWRGPAAAIGGSALLFGVVHGVNPDAGPIALVNIALIGVFLGLLRARFTLWTAIGLHSGWNGLLVLLSLPCSGYRFDGLLAMNVSGPALWTGGGFGIEASLPATIIFAASVGILGVSQRGRLAHPVDGPARPTGECAPCGSEPAPPETT
jgi:uncharacterized protein